MLQEAYLLGKCFPSSFNLDRRLVTIEPLPLPLLVLVIAIRSLVGRVLGIINA
jgi:hypothetical protein